LKPTQAGFLLVRTGDFAFGACTIALAWDNALGKGDNDTKMVVFTGS
jgi:hypothetical protein